MQKSPISWTEYTSNPIRARDPVTGKMGWACDKDSPACAHCYAETLNQRWGTKLPYTPAGTAQAEWVLVESELRAIIKHKTPRRIFIEDMSDLFHAQVPEAWLDQIFAVMWNAHWHTFQVLTKRHERLQQYLASPGRAGAIAHAAWRQFEAWEPRKAAEGILTVQDFMADIRLPLPHVWVGVSVENQRMADRRIPWLLQTPATIRFLSVEPLLGPIDLTPYLATGRLHWCILGGESGPRRRPMRLEWLESLVEQCQAAQVPVHVKQDVALRPGQQGRIPNHLWALKDFPV